GRLEHRDRSLELTCLLKVSAQRRQRRRIRDPGPGCPLKQCDSVIETRGFVIDERQPLVRNREVRTLRDDLSQQALGVGRPSRLQSIERVIEAVLQNNPSLAMVPPGGAWPETTGPRGALPHGLTTSERVTVAGG